MIFDEFPLAEAEGVLLAHSLRTPATRFKKGRRLDAADLAVLAAAGVAKVSGARLDADEVDEVRAAAEIAALFAAADPLLEARSTPTGRCNLHASGRGLVVVEPALVDRLNSVDEGITVATLPQHTAVRPGQVVATVKIIPFGVQRASIEACRQIAAAAGPLGAAAASPLSAAAAIPLKLAPFRSCRAALIMSAHPGMSDNILETTLAATRHRLAVIGARLALVLRCAHEHGAIEAMLRQARAAGCDLVLVSGATIAKDRRDIAPAALVAAGGTVEHFGMPTEPGNMLVLGRIEDVPVILLPGCGRSRRLNGLDWVLQRLLAGLPVGREQIVRMGVGGLIRNPILAAGAPLDETDAAAAGDEHDADEPAGAPAAERSAAEGPRVAALVLAAGRSTRMGAENKLLLAVDGVPMALRAVMAARASRATSVTVVLGHEAGAVEAALAGSGAGFARNPDPAQGMSSSLRVGITALADDIDAVVVLLGDMPRISAAHVDRLIEAFDPAQPAIIVPEHQGRRGNPVLWPRAFFAEMCALAGDQGARGLIERYPERVVRIDVDDEAIFIDVDRPADLAAVQGV
ncbi:NTP transferase domain-containing protein [Thauera chlorobenzoica]|uniref:CTP:molybdopterin cytidylyltransferase n=1 Tax=Thauera chlorobenzoica TaxID=96773 RepID=A0A1H5XBD2_9RHOO|nr:NTP transferase domain-containing protein [Thauera chlorobenzoica]APR04745.1 CTP:molybdopterin cytidylyltransferase [Thauera chlorobenzoica]SEG08526.1 molybdenum cofactor cytidylyltransferase [Thauera chlorobenzoica]